MELSCISNENSPQRKSKEESTAVCPIKDMNKPHVFPIRHTVPTFKIQLFFALKEDEQILDK